MTRIRANDVNHSPTTHNLAVLADFLNRRTYLHDSLRNSLFGPISAKNDRLRSTDPACRNRANWPSSLALDTGATSGAQRSALGNP